METESLNIEADSDFSLPTLKISKIEKRNIEATIITSISTETSVFGDRILVRGNENKMIKIPTNISHQSTVHKNILANLRPDDIETSTGNEM